MTTLTENIYLSEDIPQDIVELYNSKLVSVDEALSKIKSGDEITTSLAALEPFTILSNLHKLKSKGIKDLNILYSLGLGKYDFLKSEYNDLITVDSIFFMDSLRKSHKNKVASFSPANLHDVTSRRLDYIKPKVFIGSATTVDKHGYVKLSLSLIQEKQYLEEADIVIFEINPNIPNVGGDTEVYIGDIDYLVEVDTPIPQLPSSELTEEEKKIGEYVASLVNDGDTIQLGIGSIPDAVGLALKDKKDLGVHTEMITSCIADLVEAGVITNKKKTLHKGKIVGTFALGNKKLYDMLDNNPSVMILKGDYVNNPFVISKNDNMVSINTAVQVDLTGQICSESIGSIQYSGTGGQSDTAQGAIHAKNGRSIITLKSTAKNGEISTIQPILSPGAIVTLSRNNIDYIITEYGIAPMKGRSIRERVENLVNIAHPKFRDDLRKEAEKYMLW